MSLKDIKGQDRIVDYFLHVLANKRMASSYLFIGPEGVGKGLFAINLAKAVNCLNPRGLDSCDTCVSCRKIDNNNHPDIHIIEPDSNLTIKIESIRELQKTLNFKTYEAKKAIFIIKEAQFMSAEAGNAFLKILEEPPGQSIIILTTSNIWMLYPTIISRCQKIFFAVSRRDALSRMLKDEYSFDAGASRYLAYFCEGRLGQALKLKENDFLHDKNRIIDSIIENNGDFLSKQLIENQQDKQYVANYLDIIISLVRDLWFIKLGLDKEELINKDKEKELTKLSANYNLDDLDMIFNFLLQSHVYLEQNINIKLLTELLSVKLTKQP